jgi:hypothetical protein
MVFVMWTRVASTSMIGVRSSVISFLFSGRHRTTTWTDTLPLFLIFVAAVSVRAAAARDMATNARGRGRPPGARRRARASRGATTEAAHGAGRTW